MRGKLLDLQGLRFVAVGMVVAFHLSPNRITGGYVGVDVFFVISGFLITGHLLREVDDTGTVSLSRFWARRIRRLLPAAFLVLAACTVAALVILPRTALSQSLREIGAAALYAENWVLAGDAVDYLAASNDPSLVQHFWSLSTEEQFYLVWPVLLLVIARACRNRSRRTTRIAVLTVLAVVLIGSFAFSVRQTAVDPAAAYFVTPARAWEFAAGGLLAFAPAWEPGRGRRLGATLPVLRVVAAWTGLAMMAGSALVFTAGTPFPGAAAAVPVVGALMMIATRENASAWSPSYLFRAGPVQWIGDLSYAVYLWHWPLIVLYPTVAGQELTTKGRVGVVALTLVLAMLTKRLVEDPVRSLSGWRARRLPAYAFMTVGALVLAGATTGAESAYTASVQEQSIRLALAIDRGSGCVGAAAMLPSNRCDRPFAVTGQADPAFASQDTDYNYGVLKDSECGKWDEVYVSCTFGAARPSVRIALVGDSHSQHLIDPLAIYAKKHGWQVTLYSYAGCSGFEEVAPGSGEGSWCARYATWVRSRITADPGIAAVVFSNKSHAYDLDPASALRFWDVLRRQGKQVVAVKDVPGMPDGTKAPECVAAHLQEDDPCAWSGSRATDFMQRAVLAEQGRVPVVDLTDRFCTVGRCHTVIGGLIVYFDDNHLTYSFSKTLAPFLGTALARWIGPTRSA